MLQAHELFPWGPHCILDLHGVSWPARTIQFLSSWHPVLENDLLFSLSSSKLLLKSACCSGRPTGVSGKRKQHLSLGSFSDAYTHTHTQRQSSQEKQRCLCSCLWNDKEYRKIPSMYSMKQVQRRPAAHKGQHIKSQLPKHGLNLYIAMCKFIIYFQYTVGQMPSEVCVYYYFSAGVFFFFKNSVLRVRKKNSLFRNSLPNCQGSSWMAIL